GAYCARLLSQDGSLDARVDVYERLPAPYGLLRYGVAPDHPKIKSITASLAEIFENPRVRFVGNIVIGSDVSLGQLRHHYDAVILACGTSLDRRLGIAGEVLPGIFSATDFVSWYSGHPDVAVDRLSLTAKQAVVVGVGNGALDVARTSCAGQTCPSMSWRCWPPARSGRLPSSAAAAPRSRNSPVRSWPNSGHWRAPMWSSTPLPSSSTRSRKPWSPRSQPLDACSPRCGVWRSVSPATDRA